MGGALSCLPTTTMMPGQCTRCSAVGLASQVRRSIWRIVSSIEQVSSCGIRDTAVPRSAERPWSFHQLERQLTYMAQGCLQLTSTFHTGCLMLDRLCTTLWAAPGEPTVIPHGQPRFETCTPGMPQSSQGMSQREVVTEGHPATFCHWPPQM